MGILLQLARMTTLARAGGRSHARGPGTRGARRTSGGKGGAEGPRGACDLWAGGMGMRAERRVRGGLEVVGSAAQLGRE